MKRTVNVTTENILKARLHFVEIHAKCIENAKNGIDKVNDLDKYIDWQLNSIKKCIAGDYDNTFTLLQYAVYLQEGVCYPLLP